MGTRLIFAGPGDGPPPRLPTLTPEQELELAPLRLEYERTLTIMQAAQQAYAEAYGALVVATRKLTGEIE